MTAAKTFKSFDALAQALGLPSRRALRTLGQFMSVNPTHYRRGAYREVLRRDPCAYCGKPGGTVDHIEPVSTGGINHVANLTGACRRCNSHKGSGSVLDFLLAGVPA